MAIDRTKFYYQEWTTAHGWRCRLEIIPAGNVVSKPTDGIRVPTTVLGVEADEWSFEDLPFGAWKAPTMRVSIDLKNCPANLKEMLQNQIYESTISPWTYTVTNLFVLYSDRGNAALGYTDYYVEFCGGQNLQQGNKRTIDASLTPASMTVEVWDLGMLLLQEHTTAEWAAYCYNYASVAIKATALSESQPGSYQHRVPSTGWQRIYLYSIAELFGEHLAQSLRLHLSMWTRGLIFGLEPSIAVSGNCLCGVTFYEQDYAVANNRGAAISAADVVVIGVVSNNDTVSDVAGHLGGMLVANKGGASYLEYTTLYDLLNDIAKNFWCKLRWKYERYDMSGTKDNITIHFYWDRWQDNFASPLADSVYFPLMSVSNVELTDCHNVIRSGESEMPDVGEDDADKRVVSVGGVRNSATWNAKMIHNNQPTYAESRFNASTIYTNRIDLRRLYYYYDGQPNVYRVHATVQLLDDRAGASATTYEEIIPLPGVADVEPYNKAIAKMQSSSSGLAYAVARRAVDVLGSPYQGELTASFLLKANVGLLPSNCGSVLKTDEISGEKYGVWWILTGAKADWKTGVIDCTMFSFRVP